MSDFVMVSTRTTKRGVVEIYPKFLVKKSSDLMIRGGDFYAIWIEERGLWSTDEEDALQLIDRELDRYAEENRQRFDSNIKVMHMWDSESGMIDAWHHYCQKQMRDSFVMLDTKLVFSNSGTNKKDYASKHLNYPLEKGDCPAYERLISVLYEPEERHKIEWAIGSIVSGESTKLQKFMVLYGASGSGKSTILNIIQQLFTGYYSVFDAKALGSSNNAFALEAFKSNPLVAIQHDGDLSRIEDNTRLNSLVSHELMTVNEKFKSTYANSFKCFLFMGTNKPVKITDAKSGLIRRLIDVSPSGNLIPTREYNKLTKQVKFELGAIAYHCKEVYLEDPSYYNDYIPIRMLGASNDFYNFVVDSYNIFKQEDGTTLKAAWEMYKTYCDEAKVSYPFSQRVFKEELRNYFRDYQDRFNTKDGQRVRSYYSGFRTDKFEAVDEPVVEKTVSKPAKIDFQAQPSVFDKEYADSPAQYATEQGTPTSKWDNVSTKLNQLDSKKLHYVMVPANHIVIDFDIPDAHGEKSLEANMEAASKWPPTYAELSKSGKGIHLHYNYTGDPTQLSRIYEENIEIKVFTGKSSLRRKLTKCNNLPIMTISSGLPLKGAKMVDAKVIQSEKGLRTLIIRNLNKEIHPGTKPSIDFIYKILEDSYNSGLKYDASNMKNAVIAFAANSTHQSEYCLKMVQKMKFKSEEPSEGVQNNDSELVFYDVEVFPNLFLINWKLRGKDKKIVHMINPKPEAIEELIKYRLVGFNCRRYDNHMIYACLMGYNNEQIYKLSQRIISGDRTAFFREAYNLSYTDIYDFAAAGHKQSLKKFEIELDIHHHELGLPWDQPVPEEKWPTVADYCDDDVLATEATFDYLTDDWTAREILADIANATVNDTTNGLTTKIIFGNDRNPQKQFNYRDLSQPVRWDESIPKKYGADKKFRVFDANGDPTYTDYIPGSPLPDGYSIMPFFPGYKYDHGKSTYMGEEVGEGGFARGVPGMYGHAALLDIASMHPSSIIEEVLFGPKYTARYADIKAARVYIKHKEYDIAKKILNGVLAKYLEDTSRASALSTALKTPLNSTYGLTSAHFDNPFHDPRNVDNIVAKRGALFMIKLRSEVKKRGFIVAHIKTDSIKIPDATPEIIQFVMDYGKEFGYIFEHEATYDKICLVNDAVYIAKYDDKGIRNKGGIHANEWTATGTQFAVPYVFKSLFSHEPIVFKDLCETKSVTSAFYLDMNEDLPEGEHKYQFIGKVSNFCPIKPGCGGGVLVRTMLDKKTGKTKYTSATGAKDYRWLEAEIVKELGKEKDIDRSYYNVLVDKAVEEINNYGDFDWFASDKPYDKDNNKILPF